MSCERKYDSYSGTYTYECSNSEVSDTSTDDSSVATVWIVAVIIAVIAKATFWTLVCYFYQRRRRRMYLVARAGVQISSAQTNVNTTNAYPQGAHAIPVAVPVSGPQAKDFAMHTVEPPSYYEAAQESAQGQAATPSATSNAADMYTAEPATAVAQQQPVEGDRVGLLAE